MLQISVRKFFLIKKKNISSTMSLFLGQMMPFLSFICTGFVSSGFHDYSFDIQYEHSRYLLFNSQEKLERHELFINPSLKSEQTVLS